MKMLFIAIVIAAVGAVAWNILKRTESMTDATGTLREATDNSNLPTRARQEMHLLIEQRRLRPSQYGDETA